MDPIYWNFAEDFSVIIHEEYWSVVLFSCNFFSGFGIRITLVTQNELGSFFYPLLFSGKDCIELGFFFFFEYFLEFTSETIYAWSFLCWNVVNYKFVSNMELFRSSVSSWMRVGSLYLLRNCSIWSKLSIYGCKIFCSSTLNSL